MSSQIDFGWSKRSTDVGLDYIYLAGHLVAVLTQRNSSTNRAYVAGTDHLGAPLRLFNTTSGEIDWLADAEPFGAYWTHVPSSASDTSLEFNVRGSNQYFDAETGLHANWYRYYDPNSGRYITEDPLLRESPGFEQPSAAFAMNNPGAYTDPDGRYSLPLPSASLHDEIPGVGEATRAAKAAACESHMRRPQASQRARRNGGEADRGSERRLY
ncbi:MAG: RHS repeat-associated core domain-containing protein [Myxococcota bacterium]